MDAQGTQSSPQLEMAHVLFVDMVEYSTLPTDKQHEQLNHLQDAVRNTSDFRNAKERNDPVLLPTGDGMALVFFHDPAAPVRCALELARNLREHPDIRLRSGIHAGPVYRIEDINANLNVAGGGINIAQRVMSCGDAGHILVSGASADVLCQVSSWCHMLHDLGEVQVKHGARVHLYNLYGEGAGNPEVPKAMSAFAAGLPAARGRRMAAALYSIATLLALTGTAWMWAPRMPGKEPASVNAAPLTELAVLPMEARGSDDATIAFGNGLTETITTRLGQLTSDTSLRVVPASEIRAKGVTTLDGARQQFGATMGLWLAVERSGDMARVNFKLIDAKDHKQLGAGMVTAPLSDTFKLEDDVSDRVIGALQLRIAPQDRGVLDAQGTTKPGAYDYYLQGRGYLQEFDKPEKVESAITEFTLALQQDPNYAQAYAGLGQAYWRKYQFTHKPDWVSDAKAACQHAIALRSDRPEGHNCLGLLDNGTGAYEDSVTQYQIASSLDQTDADAVKGLAVAYEQLNRPNDAEKTFKKAIGLRPSDWIGHNWLGEFYTRQGRFKEAGSEFEQVENLVPDSPVGYGNLANVYTMQGEYTKAVPLFEHAVEIRGDADDYSNLATAYFALRRFTDAARQFEKAVQLNDKRYDLWGNLGDAYYWAPGERPKAKAAYEKAIQQGLKETEINPRNAPLLVYLGDYYSMIGRSALAVSYTGKALTLSPTDPEILVTAAIAYNQLGHTTEALDFLEKAVSHGYPAASLLDMPNFENLRSQLRFQKLIAVTPLKNTE